MKGRVLVIGGGIAGLSSAAYLARSGLEPILAEQSDALGGYFGSFETRGYRFERGLRAIENSGTLFPMLRGLGLEGELDFLPNPVSLSIGSRVFPMRDSGDIASYFDALGDLFPRERGALAAIKADALEVCSRMSLMFGPDNPIFFDSLEAKRKSLPWVLRNAPLFMKIKRSDSRIGQKLDDYLGAKTSDPSLARLLAEPFFEGTPMFFGLGYSRLFQDYFYPRGGMQAVPDLLERYIEGKGGRIERGRRIVRIESSSGKATRALAEDGEAFEAEEFVYAGDMKKLYLELLDPSAASEEQRRRVQAGRTAESVFTVYLGLDIPSESFASGAHLIHIPSPDFSAPGSGRGEAGFFRSTSVELSIPCLRDPSLAPRGKTGMILSAAARPEDAGLAAEMGAEAYEGLKGRIAADLVRSVEPLYPGISGHIDFQIVASPRTMERHTLNSGGAVNGWSADRSAVPVPIDFFSLFKAIATGLPNLQQVGHWVFSPAGAPVAIMTGKLAADKIIKRLRA